MRLHSHAVDQIGSLQFVQDLEDAVLLRSFILVVVIVEELAAIRTVFFRIGEGLLNEAVVAVNRNPCRSSALLVAVARLTGAA